MKTSHTNSRSQIIHETPKPLYEQVKTSVLDNIQSGNWPNHSQIPSEHMMVRELKMSRMTIHRALRELTKDGHLERIQGVGIFVAKPKPKTTNLNLADIKDMIQKRGDLHNCDVKFLQSEPLDADVAKTLNLKEGAPVIRSYFMHSQNSLPGMLQDRHTIPDLVPGMLTHKHQLTAIPSTAEHHHFLMLEQPRPCVQIIRKSWSGKRFLSQAKYTFPANRFCFYC